MLIRPQSELVARPFRVAHEGTMSTAVAGRITGLGDSFALPARRRFGARPERRFALRIGGKMFLLVSPVSLRGPNGPLSGQRPAISRRAL